MTADQAPQQPQPPEGMQRPGIPGAGNLLDPAVRGELREQVHEAAHGAGAQLRGQQQGGLSNDPAAAEPPASQQQYRAGPFPHGDVDLSYLTANVPTGLVKPRRAKAGRRFYFLPAEPPTSPTPPAVPTPAPPVAPKPG